MEQYVDYYCVNDYSSRNEYKNSVNEMIGKGWVVKQIVGVTGGSGISPMITVLFERNNIEKQID